MNLETVQNYFSFLSAAQGRLQAARIPLAGNNSYTYFRVISQQAAPIIDNSLLKAFLLGFSPTFKAEKVKQVFPQIELTPQELLNRGVDLFLKTKGKNGKMEYDQFSLLIKGEVEVPSKARDVDFIYKKQLFELIETEIQTELDRQALRKAVGLQCRNLQDLFETLTATEAITIQQISHLFLRAGQRQDPSFYTRLSLRFPLPCHQHTFYQLFRLQPTKDQSKKQSQIFYSCAKSKPSSSKYATPSGKKTNAAGEMSTRLTKPVSQFIDEQISNQPSALNKGMLGEILIAEQRLNIIKATLLFRVDFDLELVYEKKGQIFKELLNHRYGSCNFTSFVRFIVPRTYEHQYYSFIKYHASNRLSVETEEEIDLFLKECARTERAIEDSWNQIDKEMLFRSYCLPRQKQIHRATIEKQFTQRQCELLFDRMDPHFTGLLDYNNFA